MLISVCVYKAFPLSDTSLCAEMYFIGFRGEPSRLSDLRLHSQFCWWPARESGPTQPALPMTSTGVRDHTASSADDQPGSQGPHNQLCWWPAHYSGTTQPALLRTIPGVRDHTANSADDQPGVRDHTASSAEDQPGSQGPHSQLCWWPAWESGTTQPALLRTRLGVRDHTASSAMDQPRSQGPHSQLCWGTAWESRTAWPTLLKNSLGVTDHSPHVWSTHWRMKVIFR